MEEKVRDIVGSQKQTGEEKKSIVQELRLMQTYD